MWTIAAIGECMLELSNPEGKPFSRNMSLQFSYGGDTLNTAVYLARLGVTCSYVTALGDDPYSAWLMQEWQSENIDVGCVVQMPKRTPGLYMIQTDAQGERSFHYWRKQAPARELFSDAERAENILNKLGAFDLIYLSGITLSLYDEASLERLFSGLTQLRSAGKKIVFDGNYRPAGWGSPQHAQQIYARISQLADIVLPTFDDEAILFGDQSPEQTAARLHGYGVREVVVKLGAKGVLLSCDTELQWVATKAVQKVVDSTAAGDSFNAGYLAARAHGQRATEAAKAGNILAGTVIQHSGAIISPAQMPVFDFKKG